MARGDHIKVRRWHGLYSHHGIDMGDGTVIHFSGEPCRRADARVCRETLEVFLNGGRLSIVSHPDTHRSREEVASAAEACLHRQDYSLLRNNCEHFATWCRTGHGHSRQVRRALKIAGGTAGASLALLWPVLAARKSTIR